MIMKNKNLLYAAAFLLIAYGCEKIDAEPVSVPSPDSGSCALQVRFAGYGPDTRGTGQTEENECRIRNVQVFVFRSDQDDVLDACVSAGFGSDLDFDASSAAYEGLDLDCTTGQREVWAVVNAAADHTSDGSIRNKGDLLAKTSMLSENAPSMLFMTGSRSVSLDAGSSSVTLEVRRACASVVLESISNKMSSAAHRQEGSFRVKDIYLINVPAKVNYGQSVSYPDAGDWYARLAKETDSGKSLLILDASEPRVLDYGQTDNTRHTFYSYPNSWAPAHDTGSWSPRATSLVVEAEFLVDGEWYECFYPVTLYGGTDGKGLERNKQYVVRLTVTRPGSGNPNEPVSFGAMSGSIEVADWETGASYTETI